MRCPECYKIFQRKSSLLLHLKSHQKEPEDDTTTCFMCNETFPSKELLHDHVRDKHHQSKVACPICKTKFWNKILLRAHIVEVHGPEQIYSGGIRNRKCSICLTNIKTTPLGQGCHEKSHKAKVVLQRLQDKDVELIRDKLKKNALLRALFLK